MRASGSHLHHEPLVRIWSALHSKNLTWLWEHSVHSVQKYFFAGFTAFAIELNYGMLDNLSAPTTSPMTLWQARTYCSSLTKHGYSGGWRLPHYIEFNAVYSKYPNGQMKTITGWPENIEAVWTDTYYPSSDPNGQHHQFWLSSSYGPAATTNSLLYVICIR